MQRRTVANPFASSEAFQGVPRAVLRALSAAAVVRRLEPGEILIRQGDPVLDAVFVLDGLIVSTIVLNSGGQATVELLRRGDFWGYMTEGVSASSLRALEAARIVVIPADALLDLAFTHTPLARALLVNAARRFQRLVALRAFSSERARRKICGVLLWLHEAAGDSVPLTQAAVATMAGQAQETVSRALSHFKKRGWIAYTRGRITIARPDLLRGYLEAS